MLSLENHFLIAMPNLAKSYFERTLIYMCEHNAEGSMGIVVNQPVGMSLSELLKQVNIETPIDEEKGKQIVRAGGPVSEDRGFIIHSAQEGWDSSLKLTSDIMVTTSTDILSVLGNDGAPDKVITALGYAGWSAGQLEDEIQQNSWLTVEADEELLFDTPIHLKWQTALSKLGIESWQLSDEVGHA
ncbi:YqgE/AlgH family protein [Alteromonadaceae bacterium M269]|nr:YqgE/AlgH family protein [Alteromonadaceae bacterium M269]